MKGSARLLALATLPLLAACATTPKAPAPPRAERPQIPFAAYDKDYSTKPDLAKVESDHPLTPAQRVALTPASLERLTQEELDQLYARLTAGPIPDGPYEGTAFFPEGVGLRRLKEILEGDQSLPKKAKGFAADLGVDKLESFAEGLWKGKVFYRDKMELRNQITHRQAIARLFKADLSQMRTETINGREVGLLFPAKLYCGQSLLDSRRESVIIDYFFGDEIDGYLPAIDYIAGRDGLRIRDEIRMVHPGFYLGRAYLGKIFLLTFTLYNEEVAERGKAEFLATGKVHEDCRPGAQQVARTAGR